MNKTYSDIIKTWSNKFNISNDDIINNTIDHKETIYNNIIASDLSDASKKLHLILLHKLLKNNNDVSQDIYNKFKEYSNKVLTHEKKNTIDNKNWLPFQDVINIREKLKLNNNDSIKDNYKYLILSLYTYQPPLRNNYNNMIILNDYIGNDVTYNYIVKLNKSNNYIVSINNDKVNKKTGSINLLLSNELSNIINDSLLLYP